MRHEEEENMKTDWLLCFLLLVICFVSCCLLFTDLKKICNGVVARQHSGLSCFGSTRKQKK